MRPARDLIALIRAAWAGAACFSGKRWEGQAAPQLRRPDPTAAADARYLKRSRTCS